MYHFFKLSRRKILQYLVPAQYVAYNKMRQTRFGLTLAL